MEKFVSGQVFILKEDCNINIDDVENGGSTVYLIKKGTEFTIKLVEDLIDVHFEGYGIGVFTEEELSERV